ncbi:hypothetical protein ABIB94_006838 [Bradyrhizobium sp. JR7.2]
MHGLTLSTHSESTTYLERGGSEVDLKGFAFEAGEVSKGYTSRPVWLDIAKLADTTVRYSPAAALVAGRGPAHHARPAGFLCRFLA